MIIPKKTIGHISQKITTCNLGAGTQYSFYKVVIHQAIGEDIWRIYA
jgi:hypothetical protein